MKGAATLCALGVSGGVLHGGHMGGGYLIAIDWSIGHFGKHDGQGWADTGTGGTVILAVGWRSDQDFLSGDGKHPKGAKTDTLSATGAAFIVNHREPGRPDLG